MPVDVEKLFGTDTPVLGGILLPPLLGSPRYGGSMTTVVDQAVADAAAFERAGVAGLTVENVGDNPFFRDEAPPETVAAFTLVAHEIRRSVTIPIGTNVMRNSWRAAMGIAATVGASYIRVNVLGDALVTDQGIIQGCAAELVRYRKFLDAEHIKIFADVDCKHAATLGERPLSVIARDTAYRQMADALLVTGVDSDNPPLAEHIITVKDAVPDVPVLIASGMSMDSADLVKHCDGTTIGTYARGWDIDAPVDEDRVREFVAEVASIGR